MKLIDPKFVVLLNVQRKKHHVTIFTPKRKRFTTLTPGDQSVLISLHGGDKLLLGNRKKQYNYTVVHRYRDIRITKEQKAGFPVSGSFIFRTVK